MRYPVTLYFSYAISLRRPPEYPIPLLHSIVAVAVTFVAFA
jgi:hypothetical protein